MTYLLVAGAALVAAAVIFAVLLWRNPPSDRRELQRIRILGAQIAAEIPGWSLARPFDAPVVRTQLEMIDAQNQVRLAIFSKPGKLLADSRWNRASPLPTWQYFADRDPAARPVYTDAVGDEWLIAYLPFADESILLLAAPRAEPSLPSILKEEAMINLLRAELFGFLLACLVAFGFSRRFRPISSNPTISKAVSDRDTLVADKKK